MTVVLRGLTWDHKRAIDGLLPATAEFARARSGIAVEWDRQPLRGFESTPIQELAARYDLLVLDHPFMGTAARTGCLLDLAPHAVRLRLDDLEQDCVGRSFLSYRHGGLWAVPIDAACQVAVYRSDLLERVGGTVPRTYAEIRRLARRANIAAALGGVHGLLVLFSICASLGSPPAASPGQTLLDRQTALTGMDLLRELASWCPPEALGWNAIQLQDAMQQRDDLAYCPCVFGYVPYARAEGALPPLAYTDLPSADASASCWGAVIGGTGLAISARCQASEPALDLLAHLTAADTQRQMGLNGGQPARRSAWLDRTLNAGCGNFYRNTLATAEAAFIRPRYPNYMSLQDGGGGAVEAWLRGGETTTATLDRLEWLHRQAGG
jgi:multiple sugar transport system substrate-binding protein